MADKYDFDRDRMRVITMSINIDDEVPNSMPPKAFEAYLRSMVARAIGEKLINDGMTIRTGRRNESHPMTTYTFELCALYPTPFAQRDLDRDPYLATIAEPIARKPDPPAPPPAPPPDHSKDWLTKLAGKNVVPKK